MNEALLLLTAIASSLFVVVSWHLGKERLYSAIIVFLILIAAVGGKTVEFFGLTTNTGNIFYASVFLATYFLIERYGKREGIRSIWIGGIAVLFFTVLARLTTALIGTPETATLSSALDVAFSPLLRITFASLLAYAISQTLNVHLYCYLMERLNGSHRWLRANATNAAAQFVDSVVFFLIAFAGVVPLREVIEVLLVGFSIKVVFMMVAAPLLRLNRFEEVEDDSATIAIR